MAQWVRSLDLTAHTSLSPIRRGFAPSFVNYKKGCTRLAVASDKVYQLLAQGRWFSAGTPASSTTKTGRHDIAETQKNQSIINAFLIALIDLYFRCLSYRVVLVNTARPDGAFLFVVWFIHWKHMIRLFLFIDKQKRKLSIHELVVDFWLANVTKLDDQNRFMQR
jgi:hypothetical protein